jgi:hypothetical protein
MPSLRSLLLLALPLASAGFAHASDFQELVNDVPSESLRAALEKLRPKYREGVFEDHQDAMRAVHHDNPALAEKLAEMARQDSLINAELRKRQDDSSSNGTLPAQLSSPTPQLQLSALLRRRLLLRTRLVRKVSRLLLCLPPLP